MTDYEQQANKDLKAWQRNMLRSPSAANRLAKAMQDKVNSWIPEKVHKTLTTTIKQMIRAVLFGSEHTTTKPIGQDRLSLEIQEARIEERIEFYKKTAAAEGGITGAGGFLMGVADFPLLLGLKLKMLFDITALYGFPVDDYKERLYLLHIFQLAFSSAKERKKVYLKMVDWDAKTDQLPKDINEFDWRTFQQEYRDYIDIAKMVQLIPVIGAPVGAIVNYRLLDKLGKTAMYAYRMRWLAMRATKN
ncbi:MAG: EcsC family protein [Bacteroidota bacterium]|nr:EcsC family protein [Bacteroidota bacterium]